jgi:D-aminoacyl-tRNA deacylase
MIIFIKCSFYILTMYKNYLIVASKQDKAGINITTALSQYGKYNFLLVEDDIVYDRNYDSEKLKKFDFIIFASKHQSEKGGKTISIHAPGNWKSADFGGKQTQVCPTSALFLKQTFEKLNKNVQEHDLRDYQVTLECTHHGPLIEKPCIFIEIGATETEWADRRAAFVVAKTINQIIDEFKPNPYNEIAIAIGGPHYCPNFNKIQLNSNVAISHVISEYSLPLTEEMLKQAITKTDEEVDFAILDWKGLGKSADRQKVLDLLDKMYIQYKRTGQIDKD